MPRLRVPVLVLLALIAVAAIVRCAYRTIDVLPGVDLGGIQGGIDEVCRDRPVVDCYGEGCGAISSVRTCRHVEGSGAR